MESKQESELTSNMGEPAESDILRARLEAQQLLMPMVLRALLVVQATEAERAAAIPSDSSQSTVETCNEENLQTSCPPQSAEDTISELPGTETVVSVQANCPPQGAEETISELLDTMAVVGVRRRSVQPQQRLNLSRLSQPRQEKRSCNHIQPTQSLLLQCGQAVATSLRRQGALGVQSHPHAGCQQLENNLLMVRVLLHRALDKESMLRSGLLVEGLCVPAAGVPSQQHAQGSRHLGQRSGLRSPELLGQFKRRASQKVFLSRKRKLLLQKRTSQLQLAVLRSSSQLTNQWARHRQLLTICPAMRCLKRNSHVSCRQVRLRIRPPWRERMQMRVMVHLMTFTKSRRKSLRDSCRQVNLSLPKSSHVHQQ